MRIQGLAGRAVAVAAFSLAAPPLVAQQTPPNPPLTLVQPEGAPAPPLTLTLKDALERARQNDVQLQSARADAAVAEQDRVQARGGLLPALSYTTQYLGNQANGVNPNGRFVSLDGVNMYRAWGVVHQELSANVLTRSPVLKADAAEASARAKVEVAQRGLALTTIRNYYALVVAQRKYATAEQSADQASRFFMVTQERQQAGQVARADVVKAELVYQQQQQAYRDALVGMANARLTLAVLVFPTFNANFMVVDDLSMAPMLLPFADVRAMAVRNNPDVRAADEAVRAAAYDVRVAKNALLPSIAFDGVYGIEANEFALRSRIAAQPEFGVLPNLGYFVTANLNVPVWDWGTLRSKVRQNETRQRQAEVTLTQAQRQLMANLYSMYNEALVAKAGIDNLQHVVDLAVESARLTGLRYEAGESNALEVVDAQNTLVLARNAMDDAQVRYRVALAELQTLTGGF